MQQPLSHSLQLFSGVRDTSICATSKYANLSLQSKCELNESTAPTIVLMYSPKTSAHSYCTSTYRCYLDQISAFYYARNATPIYTRAESSATNTQGFKQTIRATKAMLSLWNFLCLGLHLSARRPCNGSTLSARVGVVLTS